MGWSKVLDDERFDVRVWGSAPQRQLDTIDRLLVAFNQRFDAAVGKILRVAVHTFGRRSRRGKHPEADALDATAYEHPSSDDHKRSLYRLMVQFLACTGLGRAVTANRACACSG
jgi:hypothetical protein